MQHSEGVLWDYERAKFRDNTWKLSKFAGCSPSDRAHSGFNVPVSLAKKVSTSFVLGLVRQVSQLVSLTEALGPQALIY